MQTLNVGAIEEVVDAVGPGRFLAVWLQGCRKQCRHCMNPEFLPLVPRRLMRPTEMLALLHARLDGVCFTGGEPFLQAKLLAPLARSVRKRGLAVISYSGYTLEELQDDVVPHARRLMSHLDVLIDGEFVHELAGPYLWRGSSNQRVHLLSDRYDAGILRQPPKTHVRFAGGAAVTVGTANPALERLLKELGGLGVEFGPSRRPLTQREGEAR